MIELLQLGERYGAWAVIAAYLAYKFIPLFVERGFPQWVAIQRDSAKMKAEAEAKGSASLARVYERFIVQQEQTLKYIASSTEAIHAVSRSMDDNTQQMFRMTQAVQTGAKCPLPDCPFMNRKESESGQ